MIASATVAIGGKKARALSLFFPFYNRIFLKTSRSRSTTLLAAARSSGRDIQMEPVNVCRVSVLFFLALFFSLALLLLFLRACTMNE